MPVLAPEEILAAVERLCHSRTFDNQENARRVLRLMAKAAVDDVVLSQRIIAVDALGRRADFDQQRDSSVRVTVATLRGLIGSYNNSEGTDDTVILSIPKGTYSLSAQRRSIAKSVQQSISAERG